VGFAFDEASQVASGGFQMPDVPDDLGDTMENVFNFVAGLFGN
jgi:hypothetical protein